MAQLSNPGSGGKVTVKDLADALAEIARWTQAVQLELMDYVEAAGASGPTMTMMTDAVASAVAATAGAAATAASADMALGTPPASFDLVTPKSAASHSVKDKAAAAGVLLGRGC